MPNKKDIPIVALTANAMKEDVEKTKAIGMIKHLNKPIDVKKLHNILFKYLHKDISNIKCLDDTLPEFIHIDKKAALDLINGNEKLFIKILTKFLKYKDIKLKELNDEEFKITIHTLKGLSLSIGALELNVISKEIEETKDKNLLPKLYEELNKVCNEIKQKVINTQDISSQNDKLTLDKDKRTELFQNLKKGIETMKPNRYKPVLEEIDTYKLDDRDNDLINNIKTSLDEYKFDEAERFLKDI